MIIGAIVHALFRDPLDPIAPGLGEDLFFAAMVLPAIALALVALVQMALFAHRRQTADAISCAAVLVFNVLAWVPWIDHQLAWMSDRIYLNLHKSYYLDRIAEEQSQPGYSGFLRFDWGGGWDPPNELIFDETDSLAGETLLSSSPLRSDSIFTQCRYTTEHLEGHFYSAQFGC
jgi:hypothetical protein